MDPESTSQSNMNFYLLLKLCLLLLNNMQFQVSKTFEKYETERLVYINFEKTYHSKRLSNLRDRKKVGYRNSLHNISGITFIPTKKRDTTRNGNDLTGLTSFPNPQSTSVLPRDLQATSKTILEKLSFNEKYCFSFSDFT